MNSGDKGPDELDIGELLKLALDERPSGDFTERVMDQLAGVRTAIEFGRLLGASPFQWLRPKNDDTAQGDDDDDE